MANTVRDHVRATVAGLLVGLPLLWTQEMWRNGETMESFKLLVLLAGAFVIIVAFNAISGFRRERSWPDLIADSIHGIGLSVLIAAGVLFILGRLEPELGISTLVGRIALLTIPVAFGTALASTLLDDGDGEGGGREPVGPIGDLFIAAGGAVYFALNIAPTDEVSILGSEADLPLLLLAVTVSLGVSFGTVLTLHRSRGSQAWFGGGPLDGPIGEAVASYAVSLLVTAVLLWSFDLVDGLGVRALIGHVVMLGIVASFGAAAGRSLLAGDTASGGGGARNGARA